MAETTIGKKPLWKRILHSAVARIIHPQFMRTGQTIVMRDGRTYKKDEHGALRRVGVKVDKRR